MPACRKIYVGADGSIPAYVTLTIVALNVDGTPNNSLDGTHVLIRKAASFLDTQMSGITRANPAVVSLPTPVTPITIPDGALVMHDAVGGMTQVNSKWYTAKNPVPGTPTSTYQLYTIDPTPVTLDSTGFSAYTSGGVSHVLAKSSVNPLVHVANNGTYELVLDSTERDTLYYGYAEYNASGLLPIHVDFQVVPDNPNAAAPNAGDIVTGTAGAILLDPDNKLFTDASGYVATNGGGGGSDPLLNPVPGSYAAGTAGYVLGAINAAVTAIGDLVAAIKVVTDILNSAQAEPTAVPAANASPIVKIGFTFARLRNKITFDGTTEHLRNDGDTADIGSAGVTNSGALTTRGKFT